MPQHFGAGMAQSQAPGQLAIRYVHDCPLGVAAISFHSIMARKRPSCRARVPRGRSLLSGAQYGVRLERLHIAQPQ